MKIVGIVAEYNPFHKGHAYQIEKAREITGADYVVAVMSGFFVQRGEPALYDPFVRTACALKNGADAVFLLPVRYSTASAGEFAAGGVGILNGLGCDLLCCGVESQAEGEQLRPNNILAKEYRKALRMFGSSMEILEIPRVGHGYDDPFLEGEYPSATAIRKAVLTGVLPAEDAAVGADDMLPVLGATVRRLVHNGEDLCCYRDVCPELGDRIRKCDFSAESYEELVQTIKTRRYAYTRIARCLIHVLLDLRKGDEPELFTQLLGFRKSSAALLTELKRRSGIPVISKAADGAGYLRQDAYAGEIYNQILSVKNPGHSENFFTKQVVIVI